MAAAIDVPLTADVEAGYGATEDEVAETVTEVLGAGVVGITIEDAPAGELGLYSPRRLPRASGPPGPRWSRAACRTS